MGNGSDKSKVQLLKEIEELRYQFNQLEESRGNIDRSHTLLQSKVLTRSLLNIPTDAVMLVDKNGVLLDVNETAARRLVTFVEDLLGTNIIEHFSKEIVEEIKIYLSEVIEKKQPKRFEDNKFGVWSDVVFYPVFNADQSVDSIAVISREITKLKETQFELQQSIQKHEALLQAIPDPVVRCTRNGVVQDFHFPPFDFPLKFGEQLIGQPVFNIIPAKYVHTFIFNIEKAFQTKKVQVVEFNIKEGKNRNVIEARIVGEVGNGFIVIFRDITEQKLIEEKLIEAKTIAENADKLKSNFLAQMSHEIRTPINSIINFTSILRSELYTQVDGDLKECFLNVENGGRRLIRTMDLLLNMAQIQTGEFELIRKPVNLKSNISQVIADFKDAAMEKEILFLFKSESENPIIEADEYSVYQIFHNLVDNAINYTDTGSVEVIIYHNENKISVDVRDSGIGIAEEYFSEIFLPFTQEQTGYTREYDGNGLGLAIVKNFCEFNNAEIELKSKKGMGSVFTVSFQKK